MTKRPPASRFKIIRDHEYDRVFRRDMRRQKVRRVVHRMGQWLENRRFKKLAETLHTQKLPQSPRKKTLSTCIMTMNAAQRIAPLLEYLRPHVDELVVGVDSKSQDETFELCKTLADEVFIIQNDALTCNAGMEELVRHCHGDWVLRLDDDEFPEPHFWDIKPHILATSRFTHYKLPRLHLCQVEPLEWINDGYLYPDFQMRLFLNQAELLSYPGAVGHLGIRCAGKKGRLNTVNLVHLNLAINPRHKREAKLETYIERLNGGWVHPINEHALLFEDFPYRIEPYTSGLETFDQLLTQTVLHQRSLYMQATP